MIDDDVALKEIRQALKLVGMCEYCYHHETDGEQGQIESCSHDAVEELSCEVITHLMSDSFRCPLWKSRESSGYCETHNEIYIHSCIGCSQCWKEYVKEELQKEVST